MQRGAEHVEAGRAVEPERAAAASLKTSEPVQSSIPRDYKIITFADLSPLHQGVLEQAKEVAAHAYSPQTRNHRAAAIVYEPKDAARALDVVYGTNCDMAQRGKNCAEAVAFGQAFPLAQRYHSLLTVSWRKNGGNNGHESPVSPCGDCRVLFTARVPANGFQPLAPADMQLIMANTDFSSVDCTTMDGLMPLQFISGAFDGDKLLDLGLPTLRVVTRGDLLKKGLDDVDPAKLALAIQRAEEEIGASMSQHFKTGAAVLTVDDCIEGGARSDYHSGTMQRAVNMAVTAAQTKLGTTMLKAVVVSGPDNPNIGGITVPDGASQQLLYDRAQVSMRDLPIVMTRPGCEEVVVVNISDMFMLGEGPLDSRSTAGNVNEYRVVRGMPYEEWLQSGVG